MLFKLNHLLNKVMKGINTSQIKIHYWAVQPPSIISVVPVIRDEA
jgi:hypothetical protein